MIKLDKDSTNHQRNSLHKKGGKTQKIRITYRGLRRARHGDLKISKIQRGQRPKNGLIKNSDDILHRKRQ